MKKKPSVSKLKKKLDKYFSVYIRNRDSDNIFGQSMAICITCGIRKPVREMQAGHFVSRRYNVVRYDEENVNAQCAACNVINHGEQYKYGLALDLKYGDGTADKLMARRLEVHKFTISELEEMIEYYKKELDSMGIKL